MAHPEAPDEGGRLVIIVSMLLVLVGFVTLVLGVLGVGDRPLDLVYVSIGACLLAAVLLLAGVLRGRPSRRRTAATAQGGEASWAGASAWDQQGGPASRAGAEVPRAPGDGIADQSAWDAFAPPAEEDEARRRTEADRFEAALDDVNGVGAAEREALQERFGTVDELRGADREALLAVDGISETLADRIRRALE